MRALMTNEAMDAFDNDQYVISRERCLFVVGLRRSGTTITQKLLNDVGCSLLFEPRDLWWAITQGHLHRFRKCSAHTDPILRFHIDMTKNSGGLFGAKFGLEPGIQAMYWPWIHVRFPSAKFVFVVRNWRDNYDSYLQKDIGTIQGIVTPTTFHDIHRTFISSVEEYSEAFGPGRCAVVNYDVMVSNKELPGGVWRLIGKQEKDQSRMIHRPKNTLGVA